MLMAKAALSTVVSCVLAWALHIGWSRRRARVAAPPTCGCEASANSITHEEETALPEVLDRLGGAALAAERVIDDPHALESWSSEDDDSACLRELEQTAANVKDMSGIMESQVHKGAGSLGYAAVHTERIRQETTEALSETRNASQLLQRSRWWTVAAIVTTSAAAVCFRHGLVSVCQRFLPAQPCRKIRDREDVSQIEAQS